MELRHFGYFLLPWLHPRLQWGVGKAEYRTAAAKPSYQIQQLEEELGVRLLNRDRPITLTEAGRHFDERAVQILARVDEIKSTTQRIGEGTVTQFTIGFVASTLYDALPELIRRFRIQAPGVEVALSEMTTLEQELR